MIPSFRLAVWKRDLYIRTGIPERDNGILDLTIYIDKNQPRVSISKEFLYSGEHLQESASSKPFYYYQFHNI